MEELKNLIEELARAHAAFKASNDARLKAIEERGFAPADLEQKVDQLNATISTLSKEIEELHVKSQRPQPAGNMTADQAEHKAGFARWARKGDESGLRELERKAMTVGSDPGGGYLVPDEMEAGIDSLAGATIAMMRLADVRNIGAAVYKRRVRTTGAGYGWVGETETPTETTTPTYAVLEYEPGTIYAEPQISQELLEDAGINIEAELMSELSQDMTEGIGAALVTGTGIKQPRGLLSYTAVANSAYAWGSVGYIASGAAGAWDDSDALIDLIHALKPAYRNGAAFLMNDLTLASIRKFKDGEGRYLWQPSLQSGVPSQLLGYSLETDDNMPDIAANSYSIAFGNFKRAYLVVRRRGMAMLRDPYTSKPFTKFYTTLRIGGGMKHFEALKLLKFAAS